MGRLHTGGKLDRAYGLQFADACFRNAVQGGGEGGGHRDLGEKPLERCGGGAEGADALTLQPPELQDAADGGEEGRARGPPRG